MKQIALIIIGISTILLHSNHLFAQDKRFQLSPFLSKGYINVNAGYINYPYSNAQLNSGYTAKSITVPHYAMRITLGSQLNKYFSIQYSVLRAALWPYYKIADTLGNVQKCNVWVNEWGLTLKSHVPLNEKNMLFLEAGLGLFSRNGFTAFNGAKVLDANYATVLCGAGFQHAFSNKWDGVISVTYSPKNKVHIQPNTVFLSLGAVYHMRPLSDEKVQENSKSTAIFPKQFIQVGVSSNLAGFHANNLFSISTEFTGIPIFWRGDVQARVGAAINYQRNVFHTKKGFSLDWGTSFSMYETEGLRDRFFAISVFPVMRFWYLRTKPVDCYFVYAIVGPTYVSRIVLNGFNTGKNLTYQDFMGFGAFFGKTRKFNAELKIQHYSNGNNFASNPGIDIPLMLNLGYAF